MPSMQESEKTINDLVDVVLESWKKERLVETEDGKLRMERVIDERRGWWQTHHIASNQFGSLAKYREELGNLFKSAAYHMTSNRAAPLIKLGMMFCESVDYSMDAKSSESVKDANNNHMTLLTLLSKAKTERQFNVKQELSKSVLDGIIGKKADQQANS